MFCNLRESQAEWQIWKRFIKDTHIMAKVRSIIELSGTIAGITFVNSGAYGPHSRAKRGTYTPITLADGMKTGAAHQSRANVMAKIIFDAVNEFAPNFKDGKFWSRLIAVFRKQQKKGHECGYADFNQMEVRPDYPISKHVRFSIATTIDGTKQLVSLTYVLEREIAYQFSMLRIATDETLLLPYPKAQMDAIGTGTARNGTILFEFSQLPENAKLLYVLKCEQLAKGKPVDLFKGKSVVLLSGS
jgi:hypothetical protein